jgi:hypothetical protein
MKEQKCSIMKSVIKQIFYEKWSRNFMLRCNIYCPLVSQPIEGGLGNYQFLERIDRALKELMEKGETISSMPGGSNRETTRG